MHNKILKGVASVLSAALVFGAVLVSATPVKAASASVKGADGYETTYKLSELTADNAWGATVNGDKVTYEGQYNQIWYVIPQDVLDAGLVGAKYASGTTGTSFSLKLTKEDNSTDVVSKYSGADSYPTVAEAAAGDKDDIKRVSVMNTAEGANEITVTGIVFVTEKAIGGETADDGAADDGATDDGATDDGAGDDGATTDDATTGDAAADDGSTSSKTGESLTNLYVVCALGGLLLFAAAGTFVTEQKKRR